jgi:hypothetical protein
MIFRIIEHNLICFAKDNGNPEAGGKACKIRQIAEYNLEPEQHMGLRDVSSFIGCVFIGKRLARFSAECPVRMCDVEKGVQNCGFCEDYPCEKLEKRWELVQTPEARDRLDDISQRHKTGFKQDQGFPKGN